MLSSFDCLRNQHIVSQIYLVNVYSLLLELLDVSMGSLLVLGYH